MPEVEKLDLESGQIQPEGDAASSSFERPWSLNSVSKAVLKASTKAGQYVES